MKKDYNLILQKICREDDSLSFRWLMEKFSGKLYEFSFYYLKERAQAEEAVSDVFFKLWTNRKKLRNVKNIESYLYTAVKNQSLNYIEKYQKVRKLDLQCPELPDFVSHELNPENAFLLEELEGKIDEAIKQLPERCRMIFKMVRHDWMRYKEVAKIMGISVNTVKEQMARALKSIRNEVEMYSATEVSSTENHAKWVKIASFSGIALIFSFFFNGL